MSSTPESEEYGRVILAPEYYELDDEDFEIKRLEISYARQFNKLTHPKVLGALINQLGLDRQVFWRYLFLMKKDVFNFPLLLI